MRSASTVRLQVEAALAARIPSALTPQPRITRPVSPTGVDEVNEILNGGLPVGAISELVGPECSGRTSLALSFVSQVTGSGSVCAWVDVCDALSPESAAAASVDLKRLLWVRCGVSTDRRQPADQHVFRLPEKFLAPPAITKGLHGGGFGPHPRTEVKGLGKAVGSLLRPGPAMIAPREEAPQHPARDRETHPEVSPHPPAYPKRRVQSLKPWARIEQALRVADLLLQAGGFAAIVLDMGGIAPEHASRVPLATWFRYRAAVERSQTSLLLLTQHPCAKSSGEVLLRFTQGEACCDESTVFTGVEYRVELERRRFSQTPANVISIRKPPQKESGASWRSRATWADARGAGAR
jgi:recombination protein RecA